MTRRTGFPSSVLELVMARSNNFCEVMATGCTMTATAYHHRRPRGMGGTRRGSSSRASNCLHVCDSCHRRIHAEPQWAVGYGFLVPQEFEPAEVQVWYRCWFRADVPAWCLLDDTGHLWGR